MVARHRDSLTALVMMRATYRKNSAMAGLLAFTWMYMLIDYGVSERALAWGNAMLALVTLLVVGERGALTSDEGTRWRMPLAVLLVGIWANMHGSFIIGIFIVAVMDWRWGLLAALTTFVNPYGWHLWGLVVGYGAGTDVMALVHQEITEWTVPDFIDPMTVFRFVALFAGGGLAIWKCGWRPAVIGLGLTVLAFQHRRFIDLPAIALAPWLAMALAQVLPPRRSALPWVQLALVIPVLAFLSRDVSVDQRKYPDDLPFESFAGKRVWNDFRLGGYLGAHGVKVFWDSRNDCYPADVFNDGFTIEKQRAGWQDRLAKWNIDTAISKEPQLIAALTGLGWRKTGQWGDVEVLVRP